MTAFPALRPVEQKTRGAGGEEIKTKCKRRQVQHRYPNKKMLRWRSGKERRKRESGAESRVSGEERGSRGEKLRGQ